MATHSSVLAWRIPGTGKLGGLPSMGSHRVGHDRSDLAAAAGRSQLTFSIKGQAVNIQSFVGHRLSELLNSTAVVQKHL